MNTNNIGNEMVIIIFDNYTYYDSNNQATIDINSLNISSPFNEKPTVTGFCVDSYAGNSTFDGVEINSSGSGTLTSVTEKEIPVVYIPLISPDSLSINSSREIESISCVNIDDDISIKVQSFGFSLEQGRAVEIALQFKRNIDGKVVVVTDSIKIEGVLKKEDITVKTYQDSGVAYAWN